MSVDEHILAVIWPAPGGVDLNSGSRIFQDYCRVIIHLRVDGGFIALENGVDTHRLPAAQQPCGKISAVAAEVHNRSTTVKNGVCEPVQELLAAADLDRTLMAVIYLDPEYVPDLSGIHLSLHVMVRGIPSGLIVCQKENTVFPGQRGHFPGVLKRCGKRLLDHHMYASRSASLDDCEMLLY